LYAALFVGTANAEILSTKEHSVTYVSSRCSDLTGITADGQEAWDKCLECFFIKNGTINTKQFRRKGKITFDTSTLSCSDNYTEIEYFDTSLECSDSWLWSDAVDDCERCMYGANGEIANLDGKNSSGVEFKVWEDMTYECAINEASVLSCSAGWWGQPADDTDILLTGCAKCPGEGTSAPKWGGYIKQTECYIPADKKISDSTGTYVFASNCYYTR